MQIKQQIKLMFPKSFYNFWFLYKTLFFHSPQPCPDLRPNSLHLLKEVDLQIGETVFLRRLVVSLLRHRDQLLQQLEVLLLLTPLPAGRLGVLQVVDELGDVEEKAKWGGKTGSRGQIGSLESDLRFSRIEKFLNFVHLIISLAVFPLFFCPLPNLISAK